MRRLALGRPRGRPPLAEFMRRAESSPVPCVPGTAIFLTGSSQDVPAALLHNLKHNKVLHDHNVILTVVTEEVPRLRDEGRVTSETLSDQFSRVIVRFGFMESPNVPKALEAANFDLSNASFFLSRRALQPSAQSGLPLWQDYIFIPMARSASDVSDQFCIPEDQAVEVGARITI
jgi:KUP system potassium uptake protein